MTTGRQKEKLDFSLETKDEAEKTVFASSTVDDTTHAQQCMQDDDDKKKTQRKPKAERHGKMAAAMTSIQASSY